MLNCNDNPKWVCYECFRDGSKFFHLSDASNNYITDDNSGNIWIVNNEDGYPKSDFLAKFDGKNAEVFSRNDYGDISAKLRCISIDNDNIVWIGSSDSGVYRFDGNELININKDNSALNSNYIADICFLDNRPLIATDRKLYHYKENEWVVYDSIFRAYPDILIQEVKIGQNDEIWIRVIDKIATTSKEISLINFDGFSWTVYDTPISELPGVIASFIIDYDNTIWAATSKGIAHFKNDWSWEIFNDDISGLVKNSYNAIVMNKNNNNFWLNNGSALFSYDRNEWKKILWKDAPFKTNQGYPIDWGEVRLVDNNNNLWVRVHNGFLVYNENGLEGIEYFPTSVTNNSGKPFKILPNPASEQAEINYYVGQASHVKIQIIDALGSTIQTPINEYQSEGERRVNINTSLYSPGMYFCIISINQSIETKKLIIVR